jgi:hypothetical protein
MDGYEKAIADAVATGNRALLASATRGRVRETGSGDGLIDLPGVPMVAGAAVATVPVADEGWDGVERTQEQLARDLSDVGVPMVEPAPGLRQRVESHQWQSSKMRETADKLVTAAEKLDAANRKLARVPGVPLKEGVDAETRAVLGEATPDDDELLDDEDDLLNEDDDAVDENDLIDLGPGVPSTKKKKPATAKEILAESQREQRELDQRLREGTFGGAKYGTPEVFYEDSSTYADVADLYSILDQNRGTGSPSLENAQIENLAETMMRGKSLSDVQIGVLKQLMAKYKTRIEKLRASPDREGQDYTSSPDPGTARLVNS